MSASLMQRLEALEVRRRALFERLEGLDPDLLNRPPGEGRWSMVQVMSHLIRSEELSLSYLQRKVDNPEGLPNVTMKGWLRLLTLAVVLRSPLRFKAPAAAAEVPDNEDPAATRRRWDDVRAGWRSLLEHFPPELRKKGVFRHPFAGRMTIAQTLAFMGEHFRHHEKQIDAIRRRT